VVEVQLIKVEIIVLEVQEVVERAQHVAHLE
jgi:hypothetical protein